MTQPRIGIIIGSTRPERFSEKPAQWIFDLAGKKGGADVELIDLRDYPMPFFDSAISPSMIKDGNYANSVVKKWAEKIKACDGFIIVSPEYNHGYTGVLKNALDSCYYEWNNKAVAFVSYGSVGGGRAIEQLRLVAVELQMAPIRSSIHLPWMTLVAVKEGKADALDGFTGNADAMLTQLLWWTNALKTARES